MYCSLSGMGRVYDARCTAWTYASRDINRFGFDMAFPAIMLVLLKGMWKRFTEARPWLISFICTALAYSYLPGNWYVLIGALAGITSAFWLIQKDEA